MLWLNHLKFTFHLALVILNANVILSSSNSSNTTAAATVAAEDKDEVPKAEKVIDSDERFIDGVFDQFRLRSNSSIRVLPVDDISFLTRGQFYGLESIRRQGVVRNDGNDTLEITAVIVDPKVSFNWTSKSWFAQIKGSAVLHTPQLPVSLKLQRTSDTTADVLICDLPQLRGVWVDIEGAGMLNFLTGRLAAVILGVTRSKLLSKIQDPVCNALATYLG